MSLETGFEAESEEELEEATLRSTVSVVPESLMTVESNK